MGKPLQRRLANRVAEQGANAVEQLMGVSADHPKVIAIDVTDIHPNPKQPRRIFDQVDLDDLARSIDRSGLKQPILVQEDEDAGGYIVVAGERRWRAHQMLGRPTIYAILTGGDPREIAIIENLQRVDLHPIELARSLQGLIEDGQFTHREVGEIIGKDHTEVTRLLGLLALPEEILGEYETLHRAIPKSVMMEIAGVSDPTERTDLWEQAKSGGTVKEVRAAKKRGPQSADGAPTPLPQKALSAFVKQITKALASLRAGSPQIEDGHREALEALRQEIDQLLTGVAVGETSHQ